MTQIITRLAEIAPRYTAVFCDLWGCLHNGKEPFAAAVAALRAFRAQGGTVLLLTNSPRPKPSVIAQLDRLGVPRDAWDEIVSSGDATQIALAQGAIGPKVHHIGAAKDESFFTDYPADIAGQMQTITRVPMDQADGILCTGLSDDTVETPDDYRGKLLLGKTLGLTMLCANPDLIVDLGETRLYCAGALAAEYESMGGKTMYFGKPHPPIYDLARRKLAELTGEDDARVLCIGDGIGTDIRGAAGEGLDALFVTGGIAAAEFGDDPANPDPVRLTEWLAAQELSAEYAIGLLG
jgi:HAD superfamily hydrolase (TIGR01459 family)